MAEREPLPRKSHELFEWLVRRLLERYSAGDQADTKICVILGAGASLWSGLKLWDRAFKEELIEVSSKLFRASRTFVDECWRELSGTIGLPRQRGERQRREELVKLASIEDIASVALKYAVVGDDVYELLRRRFTPDDAKRTDGLQPPQLGYELLAHFMKHQFVDHLLTFNFDELLDESVANELGANEFVTIASDQDISTRPVSELPHLIKLHGTMSRPETLRFTRTATASLPPAMTRLLDELVFDLPVNGRRPTAARKTYLISLGYGWRDPDLLHWLSARRAYLEGLLVLTTHHNVARLRGLFTGSRNGQSTHIGVLDINELCQAGPDQIAVDLLLAALWSELERCMTAAQIPFMPASRHLLLGYMFGPNAGKPGTPVNEHEALRRFVTEFVLHLAKCKGMVNLSTMAGNERINRYYGPVRDRFSTRARRADTDLISLVTSPTFIKTHQHARAGLPGRWTVRMSEYPDVKETYYATAANERELAQPLLNSNRFNVGSPDRLKYEPKHRKIVPDTSLEDGKDFIEHHIEAIFNGPEIEVERRFNSRVSWSLRSAQPITTYIDMHNRTKEVMNEPWTDLLVIAESGAWLTSPETVARVTSRSPRTILLIEADQPPAHEWPLRSKISLDLTATWKSYADRDVRVLSSPLSWWQHNRHMTLAFSEKGRRLICHGGIYFRRRHKASRIQPMLIERNDREDVAELVMTFLSYLRRSFDEGKRAMADASAALSGNPSAAPTRGPLDTAAMLDLRTRACQIAELLDPPKSVRARLDRLLAELTRTS
jgi:hypothetical protein